METDRKGKDKPEGGKAVRNSRSKYDKEARKKDNEKEQKDEDRKQGRGRGRSKSKEKKTTNQQRREERQRSRSRSRSRTPSNSNQTSLITAATDIAKSVLGIKDITKETITTVEIKKEIIEQDPKYSATRKQKIHEYTDVEIIQTPTKRKTDTQGTPNQNTPGGEKKK